MPIQETFSLQFANYLSSRLNRDKDRQAVNWMSKLVDNVHHCQRVGVTYGLGKCDVDVSNNNNDKRAYIHTIHRFQPSLL